MEDKPKFLNQTQYARYRGCAQSAVSAAIKSGKIAEAWDPDEGVVDVELADRLWKIKKQQFQDQKRILEKKVEKELADRGVNPDNIKGDDKDATLYLRSRALNEALKAEKETLNLQKIKAEVIDKDAALSLVQTISRQNRDAWLNWPKVVATEMAEEMGVEPKILHDLLSAAVKEQLETMATLEFDLEQLD